MLKLLNNSGLSQYLSINSIFNLLQFPQSWVTPMRGVNLVKQDSAH